MLPALLTGGSAHNSVVIFQSPRSLGLLECSSCDYLGWGQICGKMPGSFGTQLSHAPCALWKWLGLDIHPPGSLWAKGGSSVWRFLDTHVPWVSMLQRSPNLPTSYSEQEGMAPRLEAWMRNSSEGTTQHLTRGTGPANANTWGSCPASQRQWGLWCHQGLGPHWECLGNSLRPVPWTKSRLCTSKLPEHTQQSKNPGFKGDSVMEWVKPPRIALPHAHHWTGSRPSLRGQTIIMVCVFRNCYTGAIVWL